MKDKKKGNQNEEEILDPAQKICDPHHHLWDTPKQRYLLDELLEDLDSGHNIVSTVYMECGSMYRHSGPETMKPVGEIEFVNGVAAMGNSGIYGSVRPCASIVGLADLTLGEKVLDILDAQIEASPRFVGIRHASGWDASSSIRNSHTAPSRGLLGDKTFRKGFAQLKKRNLSFDAWLYHPQISELTDLARAFPEQTIILDHFGGPLGIGPYARDKQAVFENWKRSIKELANCENVLAKLGGLAMPINGFGFHKQSTPATSAELMKENAHYYHYMLETFGTSRCMFESNFPVDKVSCSYSVLWNSFKAMTRAYSSSEKDSLFHDNAAHTYKVTSNLSKTGGLLE